MSNSNPNIGSGVPSNSDDALWTAVDTYATENLHTGRRESKDQNALLEAVAAHSRANDLPEIAVSPSQGKFLALQVRVARAKHVLEVGTLGGYSAVWMAVMNPDVKVTTLEVDAKHAQIARENAQRAGVSERIEILVGPALETLQGIREEVLETGTRERFGFTFIDADKENNWAYFVHALDMSVQGAPVVVDNVVRSGRIVKDEWREDPRIQGTKKVIENAGKDPRVDVCLIQTVSEKNYDGFLFATVK